MHGSATHRSRIDGSGSSLNLSEYASSRYRPCGRRGAGTWSSRASLDTERSHDPVGGGDRTRRVGVAAAGPDRLHDRRTGAAAILEIPFLVDAGVNRDRDLIVVAQRGTLYSDPELIVRSWIATTRLQISLVYDAISTGRQQAAAARTCHDRLVAAGVDLSAYNTTENAADFADLRRVLGIQEWNVYGYSYGSNLALSLMRDHPDGIRTVTIDSVVPPDIVRLPWTWSSMREGITAVFDACAAEPGCANRYPHLLETFTRLVRRLETDPVIALVPPPHGGAPLQVVLDGGTLVNILVSNAVKPPDIPAAIYELAQGNPQRFLKARAAESIVAEVPEQAQGMTQSFVCREWEPYGSPADIERAGRQEFPSFPTSVLRNAPQLPFEKELCQVWNVPKGPASQRARVHSAIPTLVISGTFDRKTGAKWGRYAASTLSQSTYVRINGIGHWVVAQSRCAQSIFQSFLATPLSPETACAAETRPAPFTIADANPSSQFTRGPCPETPPIPELATRCGQLTVPENRSRPTGRTISLSVAIVPAASPQPRPIRSSGSPVGQVTTQSWKPMALAGNLNRDRDVIFMSQRGTYTAQPEAAFRMADAPGAAVPIHAAALGKAVAVHLEPQQLAAMLGPEPYERFTPNTPTTWQTCASRSALMSGTSSESLTGPTSR